MAEGKDDLNLSTECNDQRQRERQPARVNLGGHAVKQVPKPVDHDDPEDGGELEEGMFNDNWHTLSNKPSCAMHIP